jgi:hypothetical protein
MWYETNVLPFSCNSVENSCGRMIGGHLLLVQLVIRDVFRSFIALFVKINQSKKDFNKKYREVIALSKLMLCDFDLNLFQTSKAHGYFIEINVLSTEDFLTQNRIKLKSTQLRESQI